MDKLVKFKQLGLSDTTLKALKEKGFVEPSPIQIETIPILLNGNSDVIGQAQTGTGKTAAFGLPLIERLKAGAEHVKALILTPTRELAVQVAEEIASLMGEKALRITAIYGGASLEKQMKELKRGVDIVVGTPGRILDHIERKTLKINNISYLIIDEADEMLDMGFIEDMETIMKNTNKEKKTLLFSATMPHRIMDLAKKYMKEYKFISVKNETQTTDLTDQIYFEVKASDKFEALCRIIDIEHKFFGLIFCRTKIEVDNIAQMLIDKGFDAEALHGDISQSQRERILDKFKKHRINILVATDVAARGIDINKLTHVINYSLPQDPESYVHRIGRTGRAGNKGTAITFISPFEYRKLVFIKKQANTDIRKAELPRVKDIIKAKKARITDELTAVIEGEDNNMYADWADLLLSKYEAQTIISAMLKYSFEDELDESVYSEISETKTAIDSKGTARLFVALGKIDGMNKMKLVELIKKTSKVDDRSIDNVQVFDKFSFVTVPFAQAENIIFSFKAMQKGKRAIVTRAKPKN